MIPAPFDYESPSTLNEAVRLMASNPDAKVLAGGHSLLPAMKLRLAQPSLLVDLSNVRDLDYIKDNGDRITIGAMTTHATIAGSDLLHRMSPLLGMAAAQIGDTQVRNRGTIGGSLAQAHPSADYPAAVLALDAEIVAQSPSGQRVISAASFFTGMFSTDLRPDEILTEVRIPKTTGESVAYKKHHHPASGYAVVGVAVRMKLAGTKIERVTIGITGVAHCAYRASAVEQALNGQGVESISESAMHAADGVDAIGDTYASAEYRMHLAEVFTRRALQEASARKTK